MTFKPTISVVIPTYNRKYLLDKTLESLFTQTCPSESYEIIVVDDGSTDNTEELVKKLRKQAHCELRYFRQTKKSPAAARNLGVSYARGELIAFTDDDCIADKSWLDEIISTFKKNHDILGVEGKTKSIESKITPFTHQMVNVNGNYFITCNIAYRKSILKQIGGFDEEYPSPFNEDLDLAFEVLNHGRIIFTPTAVVIHPPRKSSFSNEIKKMRYYESEFRLYAKHPEYYKKFKGRGPLFVILYHVIITSFFLELFKHKKWILKDFKVYLKFVLLLILQRIFLFSLLPSFFYSLEMYEGLL